MIHSAVLALSLLAPAQCPPATLPQPAVEESVEEIDFPGVIRTRDEKLFKLPDGRRMRVPIINGYVPEINEKRVNGIIHRKFTFDTMTKYTGQTEFTNTPPKPPAVVTPPVQPPVLPPVPIPVQPPPSSDSQKEIEELRRQVRELQELVKKMDSGNGRMKKPSEIKDNEEAPRVYPKY